MKRLAVITTHPIQYYAPLFSILGRRKRIAIKVFYTIAQGKTDFDKDFGKTVKWDIPLLDDYDYAFLSSDLIKGVENWQPDAVLVFGWNYFSHFRTMFHFKHRKPVLFRGDSTLLDERPGLRKIARRLFLGFIYRYVDKALYVGVNNKRYFMAEGLREDQLVFAPHAIDNERFYDKDGTYGQKALQWRAELGIAPGSVAFVFVGKLQAKKDPLVLIRAFNRLAHTNAVLVMVGSGELEAAAKKEAAGSPRIHFLPFQNQTSMPIVYRLGDVFCLPSKGPEETWGLAVNEAMVCDRPVLVSDRCGCAADLAIPGKNGFIFEAGNVDDLATKMSIFLQDPSIAGRMGVESGKLIRQWSFDTLAPTIESLIAG